MGYRIDYGQPSPKKYPIANRSRLPALVCTALLLFLLLTNAFWPAGSELLLELLIPGDPQVTSDAFCTLVRDVREGEDIADAVTAFCREIIHNDQMQD